jgi:hypothetical protein
MAPAPARRYPYPVYLLESGMKSLLVRLILYLGFAITAVAALIAFRHAGIGVLALILLTYIVVLIVVMAVMLNYPRMPRQTMINDFADQLEAQGLLVSTSFRADRAFRVEALLDEGPHYFLELERGGILHLSGNYLYGYEPAQGSPRHFPCTEFTVRRHAEFGYVVDLLCSGVVIEPELEAPPFSARNFEERCVPADGTVLSGVAFDQLLREHTPPTPPIRRPIRKPPTLPCI